MLYVKEIYRNLNEGILIIDVSERELFKIASGQINSFVFNDTLPDEYMNGKTEINFKAKTGRETSLKVKCKILGHNYSPSEEKPRHLIRDLPMRYKGLNIKYSLDGVRKIVIMTRRKINAKLD